MKVRSGIKNQFLMLREEAEVEYLKVNLIIVDCTTKTLGGSSFTKFEDNILNIISWDEMIRKIIPSSDKK